jgi:hypothetical protein
MALLRFTSARFTPRTNDYTYSQLGRRRPRVAERIVRGTREHQERPGSSPQERAD